MCCHYYFCWRFYCYYCFVRLHFYCFRYKFFYKSNNVSTFSAMSAATSTTLWLTNADLHVGFKLVFLRSFIVIYATRSRNATGSTIPGFPFTIADTPATSNSVTSMFARPKVSIAITAFSAAAVLLLQQLLLHCYFCCGCCYMQLLDNICFTELILTIILQISVIINGIIISYVHCKRY